MPKTILTILICGILLAGCSEPEETGGSDPIPTSEIGLNFSATVRTDGTSSVFGSLRNGPGTLNRLRVAGGDQLSLMVDGTQTPLEEIFSQGNLMFPENHYFYQIELNEDISTRDVSLVFARPNAQDAITPIVFGAPPDIISPLAGSIFSVSSADIVVTFEADVVEPSSLGLADSACSRSATDDNKWATSLTLPATTIPCSLGDVELRVVRRWRSPPAAELNQELSSFTASNSRSVTVQYIP